jgi:O-acetyl-ADP-ribose deacetylase (regulator of RNase III)
MLSLRDYREHIGLDEPFAPPSLRPHPGEIEQWAEALLRRLFLHEGRPIQMPTWTPRQALQAALTKRSARPFPPGFLEQLDGLLSVETAAASLTDSAMLPTIEGSSCVLWKGDIARLKVDAIVNAANSALLGCFQPFHACIDNRIHAVAGPRLRQDCQRIMDLQGSAEPTGTAKLTRAYHLPSQYVVHTVGPICSAATTVASHKQSEALAACYRACLDAAAALPTISSIALCCISTGEFGFPREQAAQIAIRTVTDWLRRHPRRLDRVIWNVFTDQDERIYNAQLSTG